ncbi:hypothetical protein FNV43_RR24945 [Rhamnella rubrinervis]|uniref:Uncharacterized protein n=1 Tax=Rhamnella rubrinervis TaxID=2594499 RepID=A0A8K0GLP3_9ROSA|nr:hypothetical protein FNV43_RR24945 [Rhamnella rubrinervis]
MASSSSSSSNPPPPSSFFFTTTLDTVPVSQVEFNSFHNIDRELFTRLVFSLGRDPAESAQVMALWLWLEEEFKEYHMVYKALLNLSDTLLNAMADESVMALTCVESDRFSFSFDMIVPDIPLLQSMTKTRVALRFFYENRIRIIRGITKISNQVCARAFRDILVQFQAKRAEEHGLGSSGFYYDPSYHASSNSYVHGVMQFWGPHHVLNEGESSSTSHAGYSKSSGAFDPYYFGVQRQRQIVIKEISDVHLSNLKLNESHQQGGDGGDHNHEEVKDIDRDHKVVPVDDRTIFLTFSKGYPISESEIIEFITRKFGDVIEYIYMQEVSPEDQPLYARLVLRSVTDIVVVLSGKTKAKFSINGKHVWARKFVSKHVKSPKKLSPSVSQPGSPSSATHS